MFTLWTEIGKRPQATAAAIGMLSHGEDTRAPSTFVWRSFQTQLSRLTRARSPRSAIIQNQRSRIVEVKGQALSDAPAQGSPMCDKHCRSCCYGWVLQKRTQGRVSDLPSPWKLAIYYNLCFTVRKQRGEILQACLANAQAVEDNSCEKTHQSGCIPYRGARLTGS